MSDGLKDALKGCNVISQYQDIQYQGKIIGTAQSNITLTEGTKHDGGKARMDLLPTDPMNDIAQVLTFGAKKYAAHNWRKGINYSRVYSALQRHLTSWNKGEDIDPESGLNHLAHAGCCLMFLLEYTHSRKEFDDRYKPEGENK